MVLQKWKGMTKNAIKAFIVLYKKGWGNNYPKILAFANNFTDDVPPRSNARIFLKRRNLSKVSDKY